MSALAVGLVGAGPWATLLHGPMLGAGPETRLAGVWARRPEAASELAGRLEAPAFERYEALLDACDAVAFAVPPDVQAELAITAAQAGKALLLEKPIAGGLVAAERLADAAAEAGVISTVVLTWRYSAVVRAFLAEAAALEPFGGSAHFVSGALLGGIFATPWRLERGALLDLGPHVLDLLDAALGPIVAVHAHGSSLGWTGLLLEHDGGAVSEASLCATAKIEPHLAGASVFGSNGSARVDCTTAGADAIATLRHEFAAAVNSGTPHPLDVHRGLHLQRLLATAEEQLNSRA